MAISEMNYTGAGGGISNTLYKESLNSITVYQDVKTYTPSNNCNSLAFVYVVANLNYSMSGYVKFSINGNVILNTSTQGVYTFGLFLKKGDSVTLEIISASNSYIYYAEDYEMTSA